MASPLALIWLRRDLRLDDHAPLAWAEANGYAVALCFVFDEGILKGLPKNDRRVSFFHAALEEIDEKLRSRGTSLLVAVGDPVKEIPRLARELNVQAVVASRDYEPSAIKRDAAVAKAIGPVPLHLLKDQCIFERNEILNGSGEPYKVFTAYKNNWLASVREEHWAKRSTRNTFFSVKETKRWDLKSLGFEKASTWIEPGQASAAKMLARFEKKISGYKKDRDFPGVEGTSGLSAHLRFGTISIRACVRAAREHKGEGAATWLSELIWRDFYMMILSQFPHVGNGKAFRPEYNNIEWPGKEAHFQAWCEGRTGFPLVDAAMRHFNETGWMHNRLRMVVASFLVKDLLIDWRKGEEYFAKGLLDFDLAANNGGWQWSASTGCDAQPYFRIFNPVSQSERFDPEGVFIRQYFPKLSDVHGPVNPIVDHSKQRDLAIRLFK